MSRYPLTWTYDIPISHDSLSILVLTTLQFSVGSSHQIDNNFLKSNIKHWTKHWCRSGAACDLVIEIFSSSNKSQDKSRSQHQRHNVSPRRVMYFTGIIFPPVYLLELRAQMARVLSSFIKITSPCQLCFSATHEEKIKISRDRLSEQHNIYIRLIARCVNAWKYHGLSKVLQRKHSSNYLASRRYLWLTAQGDRELHRHVPRDLKIAILCSSVILETVEKVKQENWGGLFCSVICNKNRS